MWLLSAGMWLVRIEMCFQYKIYTWILKIFYEIKNVKYLNNYILVTLKNILYTLG